MMSINHKTRVCSMINAKRGFGCLVINENHPESSLIRWVNLVLMCRDRLLCGCKDILRRHQTAGIPHPDIKQQEYPTLCCMSIPSD